MVLLVFTDHRSSGGRFGIGRRRIFHAETKYLPGLFSLPADRNGLTHGMKHRNGPGPAAFLDAAAAKPALIRIKNDGRVLLFRIRHHDIAPACLHAQVTTVTNIGIEC